MAQHSVIDPELKDKIEEALDDIRPYLQADGGDVKVVEVTDNLLVRIELLGACGACPMSTMTFKAGVEEAIRKAVPEISGVEAINITAPNDPRAQLPTNLQWLGIKQLDLTFKVFEFFGLICSLNS